jgi:hypothetical protein
VGKNGAAEPRYARDEVSNREPRSGQTPGVQRGCGQTALTPLLCITPAPAWRNSRGRCNEPSAAEPKVIPVVVDRNHAADLRDDELEREERHEPIGAGASARTSTRVGDDAAEALAIALGGAPVISSTNRQIDERQWLAPLLPHPQPAERRVRVGTE